MIRILLLSAGTNACYHFAKTIKNNFPNDFFIVGADINPLHLVPSCHYLDEFHQVPYNYQENYYSTIINICKNSSVDIILPSFDADQKLFFPENEDLLELGILSLGTSKDILPIYDNKINMNNFLKTKNLPVPQTYSVFEEDKEYFIKPKNGVGSIGAKKITGKEINNIKNIEEFVVQEVLKEPEVTLECFYYKGKLSTVARERIATKSGVCSKARVYFDDELNNIAQKFVKTIKAPMYFNLQFMKNNEEKFVITDVNLRLAGGMSLSYTAGWDEVSSIANVLLKNDDKVFQTLKRLKGEKYVLKTYSDIVTKFSTMQVVAFDLDGTLIDSRQRHKIVLDEALKKFNISIDTSDLIEYKQNKKNNIDFLISKGVSEDLAKKIQSEWILNIEKNEFLKYDKLYPQTGELLKYYAQNHELILITARNNKENALKEIEEFGLSDFFKEIYIVKSNEQIAQAKAEILKQQNAILMFGDTEGDKKACELSNTMFIPMFDGFRNKEFLENC